MAITAIETSYAGCRFRSRLEARWAVFFDNLSIRWQYEPNGYRIGYDQRWYLPDFWLPDWNVWVEIKGSQETLDYALLVAAAVPYDGLPGSRGLLVLGPVPRPGGGWAHSLLWFRKGDVLRLWTMFTPVGMCPIGLAVWGSETVSVTNPVDLLTPEPAAPHWPEVDRAYTAARSARFEHGERG